MIPNQEASKPAGEIVWSLRNEDNGDLLEVERLDEPVLKGAGLRTHRLWRNGRPEVGCQWHYDLEGAKKWANYRMEADLYRRVEHLKRMVHDLQAECARLRFTPQPF